MAAKNSSGNSVKPWKTARDKTARIVIDYIANEDDRAKAEEAGLRHLAKNVRAKGFRPGRAPAHIVRAQIGENALIDATIRNLLQPLLPRMMTEENIKPVIAPHVSLVAHEPMTIRVTFIEEPTANVKSPSKKLFAKREHNVEDKDVERVIANLLKEAAAETTVERAAKDGDAVIADFWAEDNAKKEIAGAKAQDYRIEVGSKTLIPGFEEGVIGLKAGETKDLDLTFPEKYHAEELRGKPVTFHITVKEVREVTPAVLTADLIEQRTGTREEPEAFRKSIRERMINQEETMEKRRREEALLDAIEKATTVNLPEELIDAEAQAVIANMSESLKMQKSTMDEWLKWRNTTAEEYVKQTREQSKKRLRLRFGIAALLKEKKIEATPEEIKAQHDKLHQHDHVHDESHSQESLAWEVKVRKLLDQMLMD